MTQPTTEFDSPWKDALENYLEEFIAFFFPSVHQQIDWSRGGEFLDQELQQVVRDAELGKRLVDKLIKVYLLNGEETWVLVHIEVQNQPETDFGERMFVYNYRLYDRYRRRVASLAVLGDSQADWRPNQFGYELFGCDVNFHFPVVKLLDWVQRWSELEASTNPWATVVMAHLRAMETQKNRRRRKEEKLALTKRLYQLGYSRTDIINLFKFIDWVMSLPVELDQEFWSEFRHFEEDRKMPYLTSIERIGIEKGIEQGIQQGQTGTVLLQLKHKFGSLSEEVETKIQQLDSPQLTQLSEALLDFQQLQELITWLSNQENLST